MYKKLFSLIVFLFALVGSGKTTSFINSLHIFQITSTASVSTSIEDELIENVVLDIDGESWSLDHGSKPSIIPIPFFHNNFSIDRLTFYFSSRLRN